MAVENIWQTLLYALIAGLLFFIISNPYAYRYANKALGNTTDCQLTSSYFLLTLIFFIFMFIIMLIINYYNNNAMSYLSILKCAIYATLLFFIFSNFELYSLSGRVYSKITSGSYPVCPSQAGVLIHGLLYSLASFGIMLLPN